MFPGGCHGLWLGEVSRPCHSWVTLTREAPGNCDCQGCSRPPPPTAPALLLSKEAARSAAAQMLLNPACCVPGPATTGARVDWASRGDLEGDGRQIARGLVHLEARAQSPPCTRQVSGVKAKGRKSRACLSRAQGLSPLPGVPHKLPVPCWVCNSCGQGPVRWCFPRLWAFVTIATIP